METAKNPYFRSIVEFIHDIAAGVFPGAVWFAWMLRRSMETSSPDAVGELARASMSLWVILLVALFAIAATGAMRLVYWKLNVREGALDSKKRLILIKHTLFVALMLVSVWVMTTLLP